MSDSGLGKVLVTGGGGFLGSALVAFARGRGLPVRSLARRHYPGLEKLGVEQIQGDVSEARTVERAVEGCQTVFHTAAKAGLWGPEREYERTNVEGTRNVIAACQREGRGGSSSRARRAWFSTARRWRGPTNRRPIQAGSTPRIRERRRWPSSLWWRRTARTWRRCRYART